MKKKKINASRFQKMKILTTKDAATGFAALKTNAIKRIPEVKKLEVAEKTIEKKK